MNARIFFAHGVSNTAYKAYAASAANNKTDLPEWCPCRGRQAGHARSGRLLSWSSGEKDQSQHERENHV